MRADACRPIRRECRGERGVSPRLEHEGAHMPVNVLMPQMGESITEGTIVRWFKGEGDEIAKDEPLLEISTDKVDAEVPAPAAGTLQEIRTAPARRCRSRR